MDLPEDIKHLFLKWMEVEQVTKQQAGSKMARTYANAVKHLKQYPGNITHPNQLKSIKFIGDKIVALMTNKLKAYCDEYGFNLPITASHAIEDVSETTTETGKESTAVSTITSRKRNAKNSETTDNEDKEPKTKKSKTKVKTYIPAKNTGSYAILLALYLHDPNEDGLTKAEIIRYAGPYSNTSFVSNASTKNFWSAWNGMKTLIAKEYVLAEGRPTYYALTEKGLEIAKIIKEIQLAHNKNSIPINNSKNGKIGSSPLIQQSIDVSAVTKDTDNSVDQISSPLVREFGSKAMNNPVVNSSPLRNIPMDINESNNKYTNKSNGNNNLFDDIPCKIWKAGSYDILFVVDNREVLSKDERNFFEKQLNSIGIKCETRALPVGDGVWIAVNKKNGEEVVLDFIFERKRLDDLADSIKDGRFREQKSRLERTGLKMVMYIVEFQYASDVSKYSDAIQTSMAMAITYSNFHIKKTKDADDTVKLIQNMTGRIKKFYSDKSLLILEPRDFKTQQDYTETLERMRNKHSDKHECVYNYGTFQSIMAKTTMLTVREMFIKMLMTVKGVSLDKAIVIQKHYKTPRKFIEAYRAYKGNTETMLSERFSDEIGVRKIGSALSKKISEVWSRLDYID